MNFAKSQRTFSMLSGVVLIGLLLTLHACGGGGSDSTQTQSPAPPATSDPVTPPATAATPGADQLKTDLVGLSLDQLFDVSFKAILLRSPENTIALGLDQSLSLSGFNLDNFSDDYQRDTFAMHQVTLEALDLIDRDALSFKDQVDYDVYRWYLQDVVDQSDFMYYDFKTAYLIFGVHNRTERFFSDIHPMASEEDARDMIRRMRRVRSKFNQLSTHLKNQRDLANVIEPRETLQIGLFQVEGVANADPNFHPYYISFRNRLDLLTDLDSDVRTELLAEVLELVESQIIPAYKNLEQTLRDLLSRASSSVGVGQFERGAEYYAHILKHHTTTDLNAQEIHELGVTELSRISNQIRLIFDQLDYPQDETLLQLFSRVASDGGFVSSNEALSTFESLIDFAYDNLEEAFEIAPQASVVVLPDSSGGGFYIGPNLDGSRPGAFYAGTSQQAYYSMPSLTYHEAIPGHHFQIALAQEQDVPLFRKVIDFTAFVEGWALYAERLAYELDWYDNDVYGDLGRLQFEALRAARLIMDTGIHDQQWSIGRAAIFNRENVGWNSNASEGAALRYSAIPGQATAYMVGMLKILEVRQRAMDELGVLFDLKTFHTALLENGAVPLALLDTIVEQYIEDTLNAQ